MSFDYDVIGLISPSGSKNIAVIRKILRLVASNFSARVANNLKIKCKIIDTGIPI